MTNEDLTPVEPEPTPWKWIGKVRITSKKWDEDDESLDVCKMQAFFENQQKLHPNQRSAGAMLVCRCRRCQLVTL